MELRNLLVTFPLATSAVGGSLPSDAPQTNSGPVLVNMGRPNGVIKKIDGCVFGVSFPNQRRALNVFILGELTHSAFQSTCTSRTRQVTIPTARRPRPAFCTSQTYSGSRLPRISCVDVVGTVGRAGPATVAAADVPSCLALYSGVAHGFGVRVNLSDPEAGFAKEAAFAQAVRWFDYWLRPGQGADFTMSAKDVHVDAGRNDWHKVDRAHWPLMVLSSFRHRPAAQAAPRAAPTGSSGSPDGLIKPDMAAEGCQEQGPETRVDSFSTACNIDHFGGSSGSQDIWVGINNLRGVTRSLVQQRQSTQATC
ncbi:hypothetical protein MAPG_03515 [Magnaporthiopsis poae ATCC 64411]|uniref:Uncharacterized protein n=1 Tax=Magnaporthiopsis poae (strain ATCC 64411 / 73-15) TaxID=644358 RepID=A0A0C4DU77_MAGP6|nr:hypothetical protein MAPG_03515 [Magnaporthiopsis poae ATCC 64411]